MSRGGFSSRSSTRSLTAQAQRQARKGQRKLAMKGVAELKPKAIKLKKAPQYPGLKRRKP